MTPERKELIITQESSFETVLDDACKVLQDKQIRYSIRKLQELDALLEGMERELDTLLGDAE